MAETRDERIARHDRWNSWLRGSNVRIQKFFPDRSVRLTDGTVLTESEFLARFEERAVAREHEKAIAAVQRYAATARAQISGTDDPYKAAVYNQRASYGRMILAGTATEAMLTVARSECLRLAAIDKADAVARGLVDETGANPDPLAIARVWQAMDERLGVLAAEIDMMVAESVAAIGRRRTVEGVADALDQAHAAIRARVAEVMAAA